MRARARTGPSPGVRQGRAALSLFLDSAHCLPSSLALAVPPTLGGFVAVLALECLDPDPNAKPLNPLDLARKTAQWLLLPCALVLAAGAGVASPQPLVWRAELDRARCLMWIDVSAGPEHLRKLSKSVADALW